MDLFNEVLQRLLETKGIRLPMASTILRFKNPDVFQIIDQRAYRFVYGFELRLQDPNSKKIIENQIQLYFKYLHDLKDISLKTGWKFSELDRILYLRDKEMNTKEKIRT